MVGKNREAPKGLGGKEEGGPANAGKRAEFLSGYPAACTVPKNAPLLEPPPFRSGLKTLRVVGLPECDVFMLSFKRRLREETWKRSG